MKTLEYAVLSVLSAVVLLATYVGWLPYGMVEILGSVTGAVGVYLVIKEHIWNYPIGIANNVFYILVFFNSRLYADMSLQVIYIAFAIHGWYSWLRGGENKTALRITRASATTLLWTLAFVPVTTVLLRWLLIKFNGAAPFLDAFTTALSLAAQYLLNRKHLENWHIWILADIVYVPMYYSRHLAPTAVLYAIFLMMAFAGLMNWRQLYKRADWGTAISPDIEPARS
jgi:nicotinamide mononucleotide transporter